MIASTAILALSLISFCSAGLILLLLNAAIKSSLNMQYHPSFDLLLMQWYVQVGFFKFFCSFIISRNGIHFDIKTQTRL
jgi:hypothetical protein